MADEISDFDRAHLTFVLERLAEVRAEADESSKAFGESLGIADLTADEILPATRDAIFAKLVHYVRESNPALADRFQEAWVAMRQTLEACARWCMVSQERVLSDAEMVQANMAEAVMEDAAEQFERVQADVSAWLKGLDQT